MMPSSPLAACLGLLVLLCFASGTPAADPAKSEKLWVYVGTYTGRDSKGIYRFDFDPSTGELSNRALAAETANPSFLAVHPNHRFLYAVGEVGDFGGKKSGAVSAFAIDPKTGDLKLLNQQPSGGQGPCHLVVDRKGGHVLVANYGSGNASVLPVGADGRLGERTALVQHKGSGPDSGRQEAPHAHSINLDAANRFAFVADLGLDRVFVYRYDADRGTLTPNDPPSVSLASGAGPRHFAFHPDGKHAYVINEMANTITAMNYDPEHGVLKKIQTASTLPSGYDGKSWTAEVQVHPSGKFVYGSNRGQNSIVVFPVTEQGELVVTENAHQREGIKVPRNFGIDPSGKFLLVANQDGGDILIFRIDPTTGKLQRTGHRAEVGAPVCVKFVPKGS